MTSLPEDVSLRISPSCKNPETKKTKKLRNSTTAINPYAMH